MTVLDCDLVQAARGAAMEAAGIVLRNDALADRGRLTQFHHIRRRQVRIAKSSISESRFARLRGLFPGD